MELAKIKGSLSKDLLELGYHLYSLKYDKKEKILEVLIDETLDLKQIEQLSEKVSSLMDKYDEEFDQYLLDVASAGAERAIRDEEEIKKAIGQYVHLKTKDFEKDGYLQDYKNKTITFSYLDKTRKIKIEINYSDVKELRYAVKF